MIATVTTLAILLSSFSSISLPQDSAFTIYQTLTKDIEGIDLKLLARAEGFSFDNETLAHRPELKEIQAMTPLEACRHLSRKFSNSLELLDRANEMPFAFTQLSDEETVLYAVKLGQYLRIQAHIGQVQMAEGSPKPAVSRWISVLKATNNVGRSGSFLTTLVMGKNVPYTFALLEQHLDRVPLSSCQELSQFVTDYLELDSYLTTVLSKLMEYKAGALRKAFTDQSRQSVVEEDNQDLRDFATSLGNEDRRLLLTAVNSHLSLLSKKVAELSSKPESNWFDQNQLVMESGKPDVDKVLKLLALDSTTKEIIDFMAKARTQFRLARLHCEIQSYRFQHEKLPDSLSDLTQAFILDPVAKGFFVLERIGQGYRLYSKGNGTLGEIELKYRPPRGS